jgi:hypothetical protein
MSEGSSSKKLSFDLYFKDDFGLPKPIFDSLDNIKFMDLRKSDTFVCCYPKSGILKKLFFHC